MEEGVADKEREEEIIPLSFWVYGYYHSSKKLIQ